MKVAIQKVMNVLDPVRAHDTDAGLDLHVPEGQGRLVRPGAVHTIDLGVRVAIPDGYYGQLTLRSSAGGKGLTTPNGVGIIDSGYRGNVKLLVAALTEPVLIAAGERICQLIILPLPAVSWELGVVDDDTDRGDGGFGSTGTGSERITEHLLPCERQIMECLVRSVSGSGEAAEEDFREAAQHVRRIAFDGEGGYDPGTADVAVGHILGVIAALAPSGPGPWQNVFDAAVRLSDEWEGIENTVMNDEETNMNDQVNLTVGELLRELQEIAFRHGNDTPVVLPTTADADYEQATAPIVMHAKREAMPDDWDLFHVDPTGETVAVIS